MHILLLILSIILSLLSCLNLFHFIKKFIKRKDLIQINMSLIFFIFVIVVLNRIIYAITEHWVLEDFSMGLSLMTTASILATGFMIRSQKKISLAILIGFFILSAVYSIVLVTNRLELWNIEKELHQIMSAIAQILGITGIIVLTYFYRITKSSALFGLVFGLIMFIVLRLLKIMLVDPTEIARSLLFATYGDLLMIFIMLLGFKNVFDFKRLKRD